MNRGEAERLKREITALKELKSIAEEKREIGHTGMIEPREEIFRQEYPRYQHLMGVMPDKLEQRIERLESDLKMLREDDLFSDITDSTEHGE
jgi:cell division protein FtsB